MQSFQFVFEAIGTKWVVDISDAHVPVKEEQLHKEILQFIEEFDSIYSRFRHDSLVTKMAETAGAYTLPDNAKPLLELYHQIYHITNGAVTPLIGQLMEEAGYDRTYSLTTKTLHKPPTWEESIEYKYPQLTVKKPALLDVGAAGKGYLIDLISNLFIQKGILSYCIDAGGDIYYKSEKNDSLRVGLEHPENAKQIIGVATIKDQAICGSAGNRRQWGKFHHTIDPHQLTSPHTLLAVWVIADTAMLADALATCLYFTTPEVLKQYFTFEYCKLLPDYSLEKSFAFPGEFFYNDQR